MKPVEVRIRLRGQPEFRYSLGVPANRAERGAFYRQRDLLRRLHARGEYDVLEMVRTRRVTPAALDRLVDLHGVEDYRRHLPAHPAATNVPTLDAHVEQWLETIPKAGTREVYRKGLSKLQAFEHGGARLGGLPWTSVPRHVIRDAKHSLRGSLAPNTIRTVMGSWGAFFTWAVEREASEADQQGRAPLIEANPVRTARAWDPIEITRHRFLTWEEFERLLAASPEPMRAQYATLALAGLRLGEMMNLPPQHVQLPTHLHVGPVGDWAPKGYPRSKRGVRDVPIHRELLPLLEQYQDVHAGTEATFFVNPNTGAAWSRVPFENRLRTDLRAAGLVFGQRHGGERLPQGITAHTLRHTLASWLAQDDVQLMKIAHILGDTVATVEAHYAHLLPRDLDAAINRVGKVRRFDQRSEK